MTYDSPIILMSQVQEFQDLGQLIHSNSGKSWYQPYPSTLFVIFLLHLIFLYQWNRRQSRKHCLVSYRNILQRKQYYRVAIAILSHPSIDNERSGLSIEFGSAPTEGEWARWQRIKRIYLYPLTHGHLSGLPLLVYNCHMLWSCRSIELMFPSSWHYLRSLVALATLSLALELRFAHILERRTALYSGRTSFSTLQPDFGQRASIVRLRRRVLNGTIGTCTATIFAVMFLFRLSFPYVQLQLLPIISIPLLPWLSNFLCAALLISLSWKYHPIIPMMSGTMSGFLWILGFNFLAKLYWGSSLLLVWIGIPCALSLKQKYPGLVPFVDYVSWDSQGIVRQDGVPIMMSLQNELSTEDDDPDETTEEGEADDSDTSTDMENPRRAGARERLPLIASREGEEEINLLPTASGGTLTRRAGGLNMSP